MMTSFMMINFNFFQSGVANMRVHERLDLTFQKNQIAEFLLECAGEFQTESINQQK